MHCILAMRRLAVLLGVGTAAAQPAVSGLRPALAQSAPPASCALVPDDGATAHLVLPFGCGTAVFSVAAGQRDPDGLRIGIGERGLYLRSLALSYGGGREPGRAATTTVTLRRLLDAGDMTDPFPTELRGAPLTAVTVDAAPVTDGDAPPELFLARADGTPADPAADKARPPSLQPEPGRGDWALIGSAFADSRQGLVRIPLGRQKGRLADVSISVRNGDLPLVSMQAVTFESGTLSRPGRARLQAGAPGPALALAPADFVREVVVAYDPAMIGPDTTPVIEVRGRYDRNWLGAVGENRQYAGGWVMLGTVDIIVAPYDLQGRGPWRVAGLEGSRFKKMKFVARRGNVALAGVSVDTGNGQLQSIAVDAVLEADAETKPIPLQSGAAQIDSVTLTPNLQPQTRMDTSVEVWAQY